MNASDQERERFYLLMLGVDTEENVEAGQRHLARQWRELRRNNPDLARTLKRMSVDQLAAFHDRLPRNDHPSRLAVIDRMEQLRLDAPQPVERRRFIEPGEEFKPPLRSPRASSPFPPVAPPRKRMPGLAKPDIGSC